MAVGAAAVVAGAVAAQKLISELYSVPSIDSDRSRQATVRGTVEPQKLIYGEALVSGPISFVGVAGTDNRDLYHSIVLAGHPSDSISDIYFDDERIQSAHINSAGNVTTGTFGPKGGTTICVIRKLTGSQTTADSVLDAAFSTINANEHIGTNLTYIVTKFTLTEDSQETWDKFMPNDIKALVKGKKIYDPRQDSTSTYYDANVGVSTQRASDSTTWVWSENPVWCLVDYLTDDIFGMGIGLDRIDLSKAVAAADVCDATVSIPSGSEKRYTCNGVVFGTSTHKANINKILSAMNGMLTYTNGKYVIRAGAFESVGTGMTLTEDHMTGPVRLKTSFERNERFNTITGTFIDPSKNYKEIEFPRVQITSALTRDNSEELTRELKLSMTNSRYMAQRIAHKLIQLSDLQKVLTFPTNLAGVNISVGDRVNVTLSEFGYTNKTFVCLGWSLSESGSGGVNLTLREDDSSSYADLAQSGYSIVTPAGGIQQGFFGVPDPSGLSATAHVESIELDWTNPANMTGIIAIEVFASPNSSWSSAVKIGETIGTQFIHDESNGADSISEGDQRYYWVRARRFPAGEGTDAVSDRNPDSDTSTVEATKGALGALSGLDTVGDSQIDDNAVTNRTIADDAVDTDQINDGAVDTDQIANDAVDITKIANTLQSTNYVAATSGWKLTTDGTFEAGDGTFRGTVTSSSGTIGGWTLGTQSLTAGTGSNAVGIHIVKGIYLGATTFSSSPFRVNTAGEFTATNATITGSITATSLTLSGTSIAESQLATGVQSSLGLADSALQDGDTSVNLGLDDGSIAGISITSTKLYAGTGTWANSNTGFYLDNTGKFSLKDKLFFNPTNNLLTVDGNITADVITAKENLVVLGDLEASSMAAGSITRAMFSQDALDEIYGALATSVGGSNGDYKDASGSFTTSGGTVTVGTSSDKFDHGTADVVVEFLANHYFYTTTNYTTAQAQATLNFEVSADGTFTDLTSATKTETLQFGEYDLSSYYGYTYLVYFFNGEHSKTFTTGSGNDIPDGTELQFRVRVSSVGTAFTSQTVPFTVEANEGVTGVVSTGGNADTLDNLDSTKFLRSDTDDTFSGNLTVSGDLTVNGTQTTLNTATLQVEDKNIVLNYGSGDTSGSANGAGITIQDAVNSSTDATILWDATNDEFDFSHDVTAPNLNISNWDTAYDWGDHSTAGYLTSAPAVSFNSLTSKTSGTGDYSTTGHLKSGRGSGGVALTINDGKGNANVTFNHENGVPEQDGNSARIEVNTDSSTDASMYFEVKSGVTNGIGLDLTPIFRANETGLYMETDKVIYGSGGVTIQANDDDFIVEDTTDSTTNFIWRDFSASKLYLGTSTAQVEFRSHVTQQAGYNITSSGIIEATKFRVERGGYETALVFEDSGGNDSIIHSVNDSQGNYNIMVGVNDAGNTTTAGYGQAKILMSAHSQNGAVSLNAGPIQATAGSTANYSISIMADSTDNTIRVGNPNDNVGGDPASLTKVFDNSANAFASSYSVGSDTVIASTRRFYASNGTAVKAAYSFDGDSGTGISRTVAGRIDFLSSGAIKAYIRTGTTNPISDTMYVDGQLTANGKVAWSGGSSTNANTAYGWGDHSTQGYLTSFTETDPTVPSHVKSITTTNISNWNTAYTYSQVGHLPLSGGTIAGNLTVNHSSSSGVNILATDVNANQEFYAQTITLNTSGGTTLTGDRNHIGLNIDVNATATGGNTSNEHRVYGVYADVQSSGDSDLVYGLYGNARTNNFGSGQVSHVRGTYGLAVAHHNAATVVNTMGAYNYGQNLTDTTGQANAIYGAYNHAYAGSTSSYTGSNYYGSWNIAQISGAQTANISSAHAVYGEVQLDNATVAGHDVTIGSSFVFRARHDENDADDTYTVTNGYLFHGDYTGTRPTNAWGIYISSDVDNYFAGNVRTAAAFKIDNETVIDGSRNAFFNRVDTDSSIRYLQATDTNIVFDDGTITFSGGAYTFNGDVTSTGTMTANGYTVLTSGSQITTAGAIVAGDSSSALGYYVGANQVIDGNRALRNITSINTSGNITGSSTGYVYAKSLRLENAEVGDADFQHAYQMVVDANDSLGIMSNKGDFDGGYPFGIFFLGDNAGTTKTLGSGLVGVWNTTNFKKAHVDHMVGLYDGTQALNIGTNTITSGAITTSGDVNLSAGNLELNGTVRINNAGNATFGTIGGSALTITNSGMPTLTLYDNGNGSGGAAEAKIEFKNTAGTTIAIGYTGDSTTDSDLIISTNAAGTYGGYLGLTAAAIADAQSDIILEPKTDVRIATGGLKVGTTEVISSTGRFYSTSSTITKPAFSFDGDSNTGMYHYGTGQIGFTAGGSLIAYIQSGATYGLVVQSKISATGGNSDNWNTAYGWGDHSQVGYLEPNDNITVGTINSGAITTSDRSTFDRFQVTSSETATGSSGVNFTITDLVSNQSFTGVRIDHNASGSQAHTGDNAHYALFVDMDTSQTGGDTSNENRAYGISADVRGTGDTDLRYAIYGYSETQHSSGTVTENAGVYGYAVADDTGSGHTTSNIGGKFLAYAYNTGTGGTTDHYAVYGKTLLTSAADKNTSSATGVYGEIEVDTSGTATTLSNAYVFQARFDQDASDTTVGTAYLFHGDYQGVIPSTAYGIHIADQVDNYFGGYVRSLKGFKINQTEVIDENRNLANIGTISSGAITSSGKIVGTELEINSSADSDYLTGTASIATNGYIMATALLNEPETGTGATGITFGNGPTLGTDQISLITGGLRRIYINSTGVVNFGNGNLQGIGTVSSGAITSTGTSSFAALNVNGYSVLTSGAAITTAGAITAGDSSSALGYYVGANQVIDGNRALKNIVSINSGAITSTGSSLINTLQVGSNTQQNSYGRLQVNQSANVDEAGIGILSQGAARSMRLWVDETNSYINSGNAGSGFLYFNQDVRVTSDGNFERTGSHLSGALIGGYDSIGNNRDKINPIYVIGSSYLPTSDTNATNMYGITMSRSASSGPSAFNWTANSGWGFGVITNGVGKIFLDGDNGIVEAQGGYNVNGTTVIDSSRRVYIQDGSQSAPALAFQSDQDTGFYGGGNTVYGVTGGQKRLTLNATGVSAHNDLVILTGKLKMGTLDVIDSNRNLTNVGTITASGGITSGGNSVLTSADYDTHVCHLKTNVDASLVQGSANEFTVNFNLESHNDSTTFSHSSGVVTVAATGWYRIYANMVYENATASARNTIRAYVEKNGTEVTSTATYDYDRGASYGRYSNNKIETMLYLTANDTVSIGNYAENEDGVATVESAECEFIVSSVSVQTTTTNADTVDGLHASSFIRSDANDTATGEVTFTSDIYMNAYLRHTSDSDTHLRFEADRVLIKAGNVEMIDCVEGGTDYVDIVDRVRITAGAGLECEGNITAYSTTSISDINQKENIQQISNPIEKIKQISGYTFDWKNSGDHSGGVIAQEVEQIMPTVVKETSIRDGDKMKAVDYQAIIGLLVETVKDLNKRIEDLENGDN
jgi:hypothetical protein